MSAKFRQRTLVMLRSVKQCTRIKSCFLVTALLCLLHCASCHLINNEGVWIRHPNCTDSECSELPKSNFESMISQQIRRSDARNWTLKVANGSSKTEDLLMPSESSKANLRRLLKPNISSSLKKRLKKRQIYPVHQLNGSPSGRVIIADELQIALPSVSHQNIGSDFRHYNSFQEDLSATSQGLNGNAFMNSFDVNVNSDSNMKSLLSQISSEKNETFQFPDTIYKDGKVFYRHDTSSENKESETNGIERTDFATTPVTTIKTPFQGAAVVGDSDDMPKGFKILMDHVRQLGRQSPIISAAIAGASIKGSSQGSTSHVLGSAINGGYFAASAQGYDGKGGKIHSHIHGTAHGVSGGASAIAPDRDGEAFIQVDHSERGLSIGQSSTHNGEAYVIADVDNQSEQQEQHGHSTSSYLDIYKTKRFGHTFGESKSKIFSKGKQEPKNTFSVREKKILPNEYAQKKHPVGITMLDNIVEKVHDIDMQPTFSPELDVYNENKLRSNMTDIDHTLSPIIAAFQEKEQETNNAVPIADTISKTKKDGIVGLVTYPFDQIGTPPGPGELLKQDFTDLMPQIGIQHPGHYSNEINPSRGNIKPASQNNNYWYTSPYFANVNSTHYTTKQSYLEAPALEVHDELLFKTNHLNDHSLHDQHKQTYKNNYTQNFLTSNDGTYKDYNSMELNKFNSSIDNHLHVDLTDKDSPLFAESMPFISKQFDDENQENLSVSEVQNYSRGESQTWQKEFYSLKQPNQRFIPNNQPHIEVTTLFDGLKASFHKPSSSIQDQNHKSQIAVAQQPNGNVNKVADSKFFPSLSNFAKHTEDSSTNKNIAYSQESKYETKQNIGNDNFTFLMPGEFGSVKRIESTLPGQPSINIITVKRDKYPNYLQENGTTIGPGGKIPGILDYRIPLGFRGRVIFDRNMPYGQNLNIFSQNTGALSQRQEQSEFLSAGKNFYVRHPFSSYRQHGGDSFQSGSNTNRKTQLHGNIGLPKTSTNTAASFYSYRSGRRNAHKSYRKENSEWSYKNMSARRNFSDACKMFGQNCFTSYAVCHFQLISASCCC